jgi:hypothetical protein
MNQQVRVDPPVPHHHLRGGGHGCPAARLPQADQLEQRLQGTPSAHPRHAPDRRGAAASPQAASWVRAAKEAARAVAPRPRLKPGSHVSSARAASRGSRRRAVAAHAFVGVERQNVRAGGSLRRLEKARRAGARGRGAGHVQCSAAQCSAFLTRVSLRFVLAQPKRAGYRNGSGMDMFDFQLEKRDEQLLACDGDWTKFHQKPAAH